jgi:hypothetical protein
MGQSPKALLGLEGALTDYYYYYKPKIEHMLCRPMYTAPPISTHSKNTPKGHGTK